MKKLTKRASLFFKHWKKFKTKIHSYWNFYENNEIDHCKNNLTIKSTNPINRIAKTKKAPQKSKAKKF